MNRSSERGSVYWRVLASGNRTDGTWHPMWWHLAPNRLPPVSNHKLIVIEVNTDSY
ncbi:MAG: hypothetical protein ACOYJG_10920 [Prevotella sp.]